MRAWRFCRWSRLLVSLTGLCGTFTLHVVGLYTPGYKTIIGIPEKQFCFCIWTPHQALLSWKWPSSHVLGTSRPCLCQEQTVTGGWRYSWRDNQKSGSSDRHPKPSDHFFISSHFEMMKLNDKKFSMKIPLFPHSKCLTDKKMFKVPKNHFPHPNKHRPGKSCIKVKK